METLEVKSSVKMESKIALYVEQTMTLIGFLGLPWLLFFCLDYCINLVF